MRAFVTRVILLASMMLVFGAGPVYGDGFTDSDVVCLAQNISYEAPDEPYAGKLAVATVTMNRVRSKSFPKTVCGVVFQRSSKGCQFSWVCERTHPIDAKLYAQAQDIARKVLYSGLRLPLIKNALYFHSFRVSPQWSRDNDVRMIAQIGAHLFYVPIG